MINEGLLTERFDDFVTIGCNAASSAQISEEAGGGPDTRPEECFAAILRAFRGKVADAVAEKLEDFAPAAELIRRNDEAGKPLSEALGEEFALLSEHIRDPRYLADGDYLVLVTSAFSQLFGKEEKFRGTLATLVNELNKREAELEGFSNVLVTTALWNSDYNGYRAAVAKKLAGAEEGPAEEPAAAEGELPKEEPAAEEESAPGGFLARDLELFADGALAVAKSVEHDMSSPPQYAFLQILGSYREKLAGEIASKHPEFAPVAELMAKHNADLQNGVSTKRIVPYFEEELLAASDVYRSCDWYRDPDLTALMLALSCFVYRGEDKELTKDARDRLFDCVDRTEDLSGGAKTLLLPALWFEDYHGFCDLVKERFARAAEEGTPA